jgi:SAM-dependent methyltransferase
MPRRVEPSATAGGHTLDAAMRRRQLGAWYTPDALVDHVVSITLDPERAGRVLTVVDPACGDGRFLQAIAERVAAAGGSVRSVGVDIDPDAVAAARRRVPDADIVLADSLSRDWGEERFDIVIGNPPFLNQMSAATTRGGRSRFGGGPYADAAAEFLALAVRLARSDGGRVGLVLPQSLLSTRDAAAIRRDVRERAALVHAWWSHERLFDAAVRTCALVLEMGGRDRAVERTTGAAAAEASPVPLSALSRTIAGHTWGALLLDEPTLGRSAWMEDEPSAHARVTLGDLASFGVDFRDQYYGLVGAVGDDMNGPPLITSGLSEPGRCLWGERGVRFAKQRYRAPRVDLTLVSPRMQEWARRRLVPKLLIANQTRVIEAVADPTGSWLPSVPVITCTASDLERVERVLSSEAANDWVRHHAAGSGLSANSLRLTPALLASIPLQPPD